MKKLRLFDSLKFVLATVACAFILNVAHADTTAIQSVIAYGKTEQSATPTPTAPVPIMTNNGAIKIFAGNKWTDVNALEGYIIQTGSIQQNSNYIVSVPILLKAGDYTAGYNYSGATGGARPFTIWESNAQGDLVGDSSVFNIASPNVGTNTRTFTIDRDMYVRISWRVNFTDIVVAPTSAIIYTDGTVETIRDSAGHTATAQMLLGLNDEYRDEQNINTGAITRKVGVKVLDGTEDWIKNASLSDSSNAFALKNVGNANIHISYCSHFSNALSVSSVGLYIGVALNFILGSSSNITTVAQFKSWLAEQYANGTPVIVVYPLATETTESVATQQMTTAPVRQTAGSILGMPTEVILSDNTSQWVTDAITIATTKYNEESFAPVKTDLSAAVNAVEYVVSNTMTQAQAIDQIANEKQTRPDEGCPAKYCLLVEDEDGTPHWYPIAGANGVEYVLPSGYTQLEYIESTGTQYIDTNITGSTNAIIDMQGTPRTDDVIVFMLAPINAIAYQNGFGQYQSTMTGSFDIATRRVYNVSYTSNSMTVNGVNSGRYIANNVDLALFGSTATNNNRKIRDAKLYSAKIYNNDTLVRNFIPAKNSNNEIGLYDMVSGQFFTNAGTGEFTAGPDM